jgi:hypothetical protein
MDFFKVADNKKMFFIDGKLIGNELDAVKYLMNKRGMSSSKAHKYILKLKVKNETI